MRYEMKTIGGVHYNKKGETSLKGLYAAGDEIFGGISNAAIIGRIAGESAANYANAVKLSDGEKINPIIKEVTELGEGIRNRVVGGDWKEFNFALQETMDDYCGYIRYEALLKAGLNHIKRIKQKALSTMAAKDQWQLTRCLETLNLLDLCEIMFISALERRESRGRHFRPDYPFTNAALDRSLLTIKKVNDTLTAGWRKLKD